MRIRPVLVFDGDCGFCARSVRFIERVVRPRCETVPWQRADPAALGIIPERARHEALWVTPTGRVYGGARAVAKLLLSAGGAWTLAGAFLTLPVVRWTAHAAYRLVANNRQRLPGGPAGCALPADRTRRT